MVGKMNTCIAIYIYVYIYIHKYIFAQTVRKIKLCAEEK